MDVQVHFFQFCSESLQNHVDTPRIMSEWFLATLVARILDEGWKKKKKTRQSVVEHFLCIQATKLNVKGHTEVPNYFSKGMELPGS